MLNRKLLMAIALCTGSLALVSCDSLTPAPDDPLTIKTCNADADCASGTEICNPTGKVCMKTCTAATDCDSRLPTCAEIQDKNGTSLTNGTKVCQCGVSTCGTAAAEGDAGTVNLVCSVGLDFLCEKPCSADTDCGDFFPARTCDTTKKFCVQQATSACNPACTGGQVCNEATGQCYTPSTCNPACTGGQVCNASNVCVAACTATSCTTVEASKCNAVSGLCEKCGADADCANTGTNMKCDTAAGKCVSNALKCDPLVKAPGTAKGPDTCSYGEVCMGATCKAGQIPPGDCTSAEGYSWNQALKGPVVFSVSGTSFASDGNRCKDKDGKPAGGFIVDVDFYAPNGLKTGITWADKVKQVQFFQPNKTKSDAGIVELYPSAPATYGSFKVGMCGSAATAVSFAGYSLYLIDSEGAGGNVACLE